jgi:hypothetical protein
VRDKRRAKRKQILQVEKTKRKGKIKNDEPEHQ